MKKLLIPALLLLVTCYSCGNFMSQVKEMAKLQVRLQKQFNFKEINIKTVNGQSLLVSVVNSRYNDSSDEAKQRMADSIGSVCAPFMQSDTLPGGSVAFVKSLDGGIVNASVSNSYPMHNR